ncbi:hypothetical protein COOONC_00765 [Cooperia oncophora]
MKTTQDLIRNKVDKQVPRDLNDLSAKTDNITSQLIARLNKEEEERYDLDYACKMDLRKFVCTIADEVVEILAASDGNTG